ncbi:hypothetical protein ACJX0J_039111, partial [Zea mays]
RKHYIIIHVKQNPIERNAVSLLVKTNIGETVQPNWLSKCCIPYKQRIEILLNYKDRLLTHTRYKVQVQLFGDQN